MKQRGFIISFISCLMLSSLLWKNAFAGDFLKCEHRTRVERSKISVQTEDLTPGAIYTAIVESNGNTAMASAPADLAGEVEYDFDSNINDILAGATALSNDFVGDTASATVTDALGNVVDSGSAGCRNRR